ncbi:immunity protein 26 of polymorphic toxin system [Chitinophaga dinghuensis]|uniref:Immunity protein 26 of polymorphic toxin system n=1 Tax=Chitinophaga dinghuensis TaxID=1539050 RepID=A0A327VPP6_9BACT|nr:immunity 26/phosphotriesterase HocA family protein [Chitinophaga dinghuensis]RAJ77305.1 immunity protein 26 of polymorphic toxin system [Chitinophaga dinghuensis]
MGVQRITIGSIIKIDLPCGKIGYGRILGKANYGFYDYYTDHEETDLSCILDSRILFIVAVYNDAITNGRWKKIGKKDLEEALKLLPMKFIQDKLNPAKFEIYDPNTGDTRPTDVSECIDLERAAVWEPYNVEQRLCDHFNGVPNDIFEEMRIKL